MTIIREEEINKKVVREVAERLLIAARTAPKARGMDNLSLAIAEGDTIKLLAAKMLEISARLNAESISRDAYNIEKSPAVVLIGTKIKSIGLQEKCGYCGYKNCDEKDKHPEHPCIYNTHDLGLAVGSAVSIAMDNRIDNRVMYSIGKAALELNLMGDDVRIIMGIPLSATKKSPFFDRKG